MENSSTFKRALGANASDTLVEAAGRERLRNALKRMRDQCALIVGLIPASCHQLTIHDITHLDALWDMADLIIDETFELSPAEAFVFGASVLIHDSGLTLAAYSNGLTEIKETVEWRDLAFSTLRKSGRTPSPELIREPPADCVNEITFLTLRSLHAKQAEKLIRATWRVPNSDRTIRLLEDDELLSSYGDMIGRIAHSHHWNISRLAESLRQTAGVAPFLPPQWDVNEIKIACLLRCCDAAHIDHRRAPALLYSLVRPTGVSDHHWNFQGKLNRPVTKGGALVYSSGEKFTLADADAWWLCFDTIKLIDRELRDSSDLLRDMQFQPFAATRVFGSESPLVLAQQIGVEGWKPVDAEIRVSNPVHLALTLGGANLYGRGLIPALREILQNAADAVRGRRKLQRRTDEWGKIRVSLEEKGQEFWLHFDDDGLGMSERTLIGSLLDFGNTFWNSSAIREEWPGLESSGIEPIGKFGIGFFAVFALGDRVKVTSKRYDAGLADARTLEFYSIGRRPILRPATSFELPQECSTRISVRLNDTLEYWASENDDDSSRGIKDSRKRQLTKGAPPVALQTELPSITSLISALDVDVDFDLGGGHALSHKWNWHAIEPQKNPRRTSRFLREERS